MKLERCGSCEACYRIDAHKRWAVPNPPFTHASDDTVRMWNQMLWDNPCAAWDSEQLVADREALLRVSYAVRPGLARELEWLRLEPHYQLATLSNPDGKAGVSFDLLHQPTRNRRGPWRLQITVAGGKYHYAWGCFDDQDQPLRYYFSEAVAKGEANALAQVLQSGFRLRPITGSDPT